MTMDDMLTFLFLGCKQTFKHSLPCVLLQRRGEEGRRKKKKKKKKNAGTHVV